MTRRKRMLDDLDRDIRDHIARETQDNMDRGMAPDDAHYAAIRKFGNVTRIKEDARNVWSLVWLDQFLQDIRYGLRMLRKSPGFTAIAVLTLALGIGANTAIFSVVNAILLKPLPYPDARRLAVILASYGNEHRAPVSGFDFEQIRDNSRQFDEIGAIWVTNGVVTGLDDPQPEPVKLADVTDGFLPLLSGRLALGRFFVLQDHAPNAPAVAIISNGVWRGKFGSDPHIVGKSLHSRSGALMVVGVLPEDFHLIFPDDSNVPANPDVYVLLTDQYTQPGGPAFLHLIGRVRAGATFAQAQSEADSIAEKLRAMVKGYGDQNFRLQVVPLQDDDVRNVRRVLAILFGGVGIVLLIACANVANLLLARADNRERETIIRAALGASRGRVIRQLLTESMVLATFGGIAAVAVGWGALQELLSLRPESLMRLGTIRLDTSAFAFTFVIALVTGMIFGLAPALGAARFDLAAGLKRSGRGFSSARQMSKGALILCEVALSFVLLTGTGLLLRTFVSVLRVNPGFQPTNVFSFTTLGGDYHFLQQLQKNLGGLPGVQSVSVVSHVPLDDNYGNWYDYYWPEGSPPEQQSTVMADYRSVMPGYFQTLGASLLAGRDFTDFDDATHQHVAIVDDALAAHAWPGQDPLGKKLHVSDSPAGWYQFQEDWVVVVGVVRHVQYHSLTVMVRPQIYVPYLLAPRPVSFVLRSSSPLPSLVSPIREQAAKLNKTVAVTRFVALSDLVAKARSQARFVAFLSAALAALALFLSCIGVYGVTSYLVMSRTPEIGVRMALGAQPSDVRGLVFGRGMLPVVCGCLLGIVLSLPLTPLISALLFGVRPIDLPTLLLAALFLSAIGFLSCYIPARRAMRVDPMVALRHE
jgi:predicted permease